MGHLHIQTFGAFYVSLDQERVTFDTDKTGALLVYLAVESGRPHPREQLAGLLWSDLPQERALHNLRQALSYLRKALREDRTGVPFLLSTRDSLQWNPSGDAWLDLAAFTTGLDAADHHHQRRGGRGWLNIRAARRALDLYQGLFLDQFFLAGSPLFDEWASLQREVLNARALQALEKLAEYHERRGEFTLARQAAARITTLAPWEENARVHLMRLLALDGQWSSAQHQYGLLRRALAEQLGLEPSPQATALFEEIRRAAGGQGALAGRYPPAPVNLPEAPTAFIGRAADLDELAERISDPECRLLTLMGPGGMGKTRLALEAAREQVGIFSDGVFFVSLLTVEAPAQLPAAIGAALGLVFSERGDPRAQLIDYLRRKNLLLLLDNFEHLARSTENTGLLSQIFHAAPDVMILVTSRERLNLQEECIFGVEGLACPPADGPEPGEIERYDACALFLQRAHRVHGHFVAEAQDRAAVVQICRLLEGLPLGVELAAAALLSQTCAQIAAGLVANLHELNAAASNVPARHRSLRAAFDVSWNLLSPEQQTAFCGLGIFRGGCAPEAAGWVLGEGAAHLAALVDQSLLRPGSAGRYEIHEAVRQYAAERLAERPAWLAEAEQRHAAFFLKLLAERRGELTSAAQGRAIAALQTDLENIRLAWDYALAQADLPGLEGALDPLYHFFNITSRFREGIALFSASGARLEQVPGGEHALLMTLSRCAALAYRIRDQGLLESALARTRVLLAGIADPREAAFDSINRGGLAIRRKDHAAALEYARRGQALYHLAGDLWGECYAGYLEALVYSRVGRWAEMVARAEAIVRVHRQTGNERSLVAPLNLLADAACVQGDYARAETIFNEALEISRRLNDRYNQAIILNNLATVYHVNADHAREKAALDASLMLCRDIGDRDGEAIALNNLGEMCVAQKLFEPALDYSRQALEMAYETGEEWAQVVCRNNLGEACLGLERYAEAEDHLRASLRLARKIEAVDQAARVAANLARLDQSAGRIERAVELAQAALAHPATEEAAREVCRQVLKAAGAPAPDEGADESRLDEVVKKLFED